MKTHWKTALENFGGALRRSPCTRDLPTLAIAIAVLALVGTTWILSVERIRYEFALTVADTEKQNTNLVLALEEHSYRTIKDVDQVLAGIVREYRDHGTKLDFRKLFAEGSFDDRLFHFIGVVDVHGDLILGSKPFRQTYLGDRDYFRVHAQSPGRGIFIDTPMWGRVTDKWAIPMSRRIDKPDGSFDGIVYASVDPHYFTDFYGKADLGKQGLVTLVGLDGITRARRSGPNSSFGQEMRASTLMAEQAKKPAGNFFSAGRLDSVPRFFSYRTLAEYPLIVAVGTSEAETLSGYQKRRNVYMQFAALASAFLAAAGAGLIVALKRQRRAAKIIARGNARFRATFDQAAVGISLNGLDGKFLDANQAYCSMLGYTAQELLGRSFLDILHPEAHAAANEGVRRMLAGTESFLPSFENRHIRKDGTILWALVTVALVRDDEGRPDYLVAVVQDVTERKQAQQQLEFQHAILTTQREASLDAILVVDANAKIISYNRRFVELWAIPEEMAAAGDDEPVLASVVDKIRDPDGFLAKVRYLYEHRDEESRDEFLTKDGRTIDRYSAPAVGENGRYFGRVWYFRDITARKRAEEALRESQEQFQQLADNIPEVFWITDARQTRLLYASPAYEKICGRSFATQDEAWAGWKAAIHPEDRDRAIAAYRRSRDGALDETYRVVRPDGSIRWVHARGFPVRGPDGETQRITGTIDDVTERHEMQERLVHQAHFDGLTGLPNRTLCFDRLTQALSRAQRKQQPLSFLFVDLDRFKNINDTLGHGTGDALLKQVAARMVRCVRTGDTVARLGGDEFAVILPEVSHAEDAALVAQKILETLAQPFDLDGREAYVTASIGIASFPADSDDAEALVKNADAAMFRAKLSGRNKYEYYTAAMNARAIEKLELENSLRRALERREFLLHFQPKINLDNRKVAGCEALLRWNKPGKGLVSPGEFIPLLEETGLIVPVGEWALDAACAQQRAWLDAGVIPVPVAVNLSAKQFQRKDICAMVTAALEAHGIEPRLLEVEITESAAMQNVEETVATLEKLRAIGVHVSVDDFGTGYSSLGYLKRLPISALKIDRSFVTGLPENADDVSIAKAVIGMARSLHLKVIAEGVETEEQRMFLAANGCDEMQGYLAAKPMPAGEFVSFLQSRRRLFGVFPHEREAQAA